MSDDLERLLIERLGDPTLPAAPRSIVGTLDRLATTTPPRIWLGTAARPAVVVALVVALAALVIIGGSLGGPLASTASPHPSARLTLGPTARATSPPGPTPSTTLPTPSATPAPILGGAWTSTATAPIDGRTGHVMVWTGTEVLVWGGTASSPTVPVGSVAPSDGAAYDPATDTWRRIPDAPILGREAPLAAWTGRELLVWGGRSAPEQGSELVADGAAYDPATNRWRTIPAAPLAVEPGPGTVVGGWVGGAYVVITDTGAARYDPGTDQWTALRPAPIEAGGRVAAVTEDRLVLIAFGDGATAPVSGAVLDPTDWSWSTLDVPLGLLDFGIEVISTDHAVVIPGRGLALDPISRTWTAGTPCPRAGNGGVWTGRRVLGVSAAFDPTTGICATLPPAPARTPPFDGTNGREYAVAVWTGAESITWSGGTGADYIWVPNDGAIFRPTEP